MLEVPWVEAVGIPDATEGDDVDHYNRLVAVPSGEAMQRCMGGVEPSEYDWVWVVVGLIGVGG